jgi:hypothetical protein
MSFTWAQPERVQRDDAGVLHLSGWLKYAPDRVPALWWRIPELREEPDGWLHALETYGPLTPDFGETAQEERVRDGWKHVIGGLATVRNLWRGNGGIFALSDTPPLELTKGYKLLQTELGQVACDWNSARPLVRGLDVIQQPYSLYGYLWLSAAEAARERHRFRRCDRCSQWMKIKRTDAQYCSAICRNKREDA